MSKPAELARKKRNRHIKRRADILIDVCMPIFGEFDMAAKAIDCVEEAAAPLDPSQYRMVVIDNGTPEWINNDGVHISPEEMSKEVAAMMRPQDTFFRIEQNKGYPGGVNEAVTRGSAPLVLILTSDVFLKPGSIHAMVRDMDDPTVGVVGPKLIFPEDVSPHGPAGKVQHCGMAVKITGAIFHPLIGWSPEHPHVNVRREVCAVTGACFLTRRKTWVAIGGFDQRYGLGTFEDMDYCFEVRERQERVIYEPRAEGYHLVGGASVEGANRGFNLAMNNAIFRGKWAHRLFWDEWQFW